MIDVRAPEQLTVAELVQTARHEIAQFLRGQPADDAYAFVLFRRAIARGDELAWSGLYDLYHIIVSVWIARQAPALLHEDREALTNETFAKFYRSISPEKVERFPSVQALLAYLKRCAWSVTADYCRSQQARIREETFEFLDQAPVLDDPADVVAAQFAAQEFWRIIDREVTDSEERLILRAMCALGLSPRQLQQRYPLLFPTVDDIYRIRRNVLERLRRNQLLLALKTQKFGQQQAQMREEVLV